MKTLLIVASTCLTLMSATAYADGRTAASYSGTTAGNRTPEQIERRGERIEQRLDRRGDRIENHLDAKGNRIERRLDAKADDSRAAGNIARAEALERQGDKINARLDKKGRHIDRRMDRKGERIEHRHDRRARLARS